MKHFDYDINYYQSKFRPQVLHILGHLLGSDAAGNEQYFRWKYEQDKDPDEVLGIVATHDGQVAGFRGYAAAAWHVGDSNQTVRVLVPGDTCVDPDHRRKGLTVAMGKFAMANYASSYDVFMNLSCTRNSLPGYLRMGFEPLVDKIHSSRYNLFGLARCILASRKQLPLSKSKVRYGQFDDVLVTDHPLPGEMASVIKRQGHGRESFHPVQDEAFFRLRYANPRSKYVFCYHLCGGTVVGYLVIGLGPSNQRGHILDFADVNGESAARLVKYIAAKNYFGVLSIFRYSIDDVLEPSLCRLGFHSGGLMNMLEKKVRGNLPILVRPVCLEPVESDWIVAGRDIRKMENWSIKGICSDAM